jgi:hypothetical protein
MAAHPAPGEDEDRGLADLGQMFEDEDGWQGPRVDPAPAAQRAEPAAQPAQPAGAVAEPGSPETPAAAPRRPRGTAADLRLLRSSSAVRARAIAAVVVPFVLYVLVMVVIGRGDRFVLFLWAPILVAGVLVGAVLDLGHRDARRVRG